MAKVKDYRDGFKEWLSERQPRCSRCGGYGWMKLEDPCFRCQGSGVEPDPASPS